MLPVLDLDPVMRSAGSWTLIQWGDRQARAWGIAASACRVEKRFL